MEPILVTGGAGFIGSNFVRDCIAAGTPIVNLDALTYAGNLGNLDGIMEHEAHVFAHGSINDRALLDRLLATHRPRAIVNFAAESHVDRSIDAPGNFVDTNIVGTFTLLEAALAHWRARDETTHQPFRFLHVSTDEVYGSIEDGLFSEDSAYAPNSPYAASKAAADQLVRAYNRTYGLATLITNCGNNYGPRQFPEKLIPLMILNAIEEKPLPIYGDGRQIRDWLYVADHCAALTRVLESGRPGETYLIGGAGGERSNRDVVFALCAILDELKPRASGQSHAALIEHVADRPGHDQRYALDAGKIARELRWQPKTPFEDGLRATVRWYLDHPSWWEAIRSGAYRGERLGLARTMSGS